jgi:hypothetical protein
LRFLIGPWRWVILVYEALDGGERVVVVSVQDGRSSRAVSTIANRTFRGRG